MKYHIKFINSFGIGECRSDLEESDLISRYIEPYEYGEDIVINGKTFSLDEILKVTIKSSKGPIKDRISEIELGDAINNDPLHVLSASAEWRAIDEFDDVTNDYIQVAKGSKKRNEVKKVVKVEFKDKFENSKEKVFVVHGHDDLLKNEVELFLHNLNLEPIVLHRELDEGQTIIEKFEKHSDVVYALILLTPDDIGYSVSEHEKPESERKIKFRARQNVIFEFGYFVGKLSRKNVCCIYKSEVELPSDLNGLIYKKVNKSIEEVGFPLIKEMKNVGLNLKLE